MLGIVVSQELTASVFSVIVYGKAVHLFPFVEYGVFLSCDDPSFVASPGFWAVDGFSYVNTINETTGSDNGRLSDKIITVYLNTLTH